jgi:adenosine deaminase
MKPDIKGLHHDHIDGSRAVFEVIEDLYRLADKRFPFQTKKDWLAFFRDPQEDIVARFDTITGVMQSAEALETVAYAYGRTRAGDGYAYVEGKFAPQYHTRGGLSMSQVVAAVSRGLKRAENEFGIRILPVIVIGREADPDTGVAIARIALEYGGETALDLACDEAGSPPEKHLPAFKLTLGTPVKRDCHAGEWVATEPASTYRRRLLKNIRTAVYDLRCDGVGHAIPLVDDPELIAYMAENGIRVSGCPLSNLYSGLIRGVGELGIDKLLDSGVIYTLNADDDLFMPSMSDTVAACEAAYSFTPAQKKMLEDNVFRGAFAADVAAKTTAKK